MEEKQEISWLRIQCPKCESRYRIDRAKIPPQGASVHCKKCGTKIILKRKPETSAGKPAPSPAATDTCPKCGFHQEQGEFCYQCGTRMRQAPMKSPNQTNDAPQQDIPSALIEITMEYKSSNFLLSTLKPMIEIDGELYPRTWGRHQFEVPPGKYNIKCYSEILGKHFGEQLLDIEMEKDSYIELKYSIESRNIAELKISKKQQNAPWRSLIQRPESDERDPWYLKPYPVIFLLVTFFPAGLYLLWRSKHFSDSHKLFIAIVSLAAFIWVLLNIKPGPV